MPQRFGDSTLGMTFMLWLRTLPLLRSCMP